jgi:hypothetical protein
MKTTILALSFFVIMVFGTVMMVFGNHFGDVIVVIGAIAGLFIMEEDEKKFSDEGMHEKYEPRRHDANRGSN